jgi:hypothetical protein
MPPYRISLPVAYFSYPKAALNVCSTSPSEGLSQMLNQDELELLFKRLPTVEDNDGLIWLNGYLLRGPLDCVRFVTGQLFLDFDNRDVVTVEERAPGERYAIPVRIAIRSGVTIRDIGSSEPFEPLIRKGRIPFAIATRESTKQTDFNTIGRLSKFTASERRFLEKYGFMCPGRES